MLRPAVFHNPDRALDISVGKIRHELAEVTVIALSILILDHNLAEVGFCHDVNAEIAGCDLAPGVGHTESKNLVQFLDIAP